MGILALFVLVVQVGRFFQFNMTVASLQWSVQVELCLGNAIQSTAAQFHVDQHFSGVLAGILGFANVPSICEIWIVQDVIVEICSRCECFGHGDECLCQVEYAALQSQQLNGHTKNEQP